MEQIDNDELNPSESDSVTLNIPSDQVTVPIVEVTNAINLINEDVSKGYELYNKLIQQSVFIFFCFQ